MTYEEPAAPRPTGWVGWILFGAIILVVNGMFAILQGLAGILRDETYFLGGQVLVLDYTAWGWIHLLLGVLLVTIGVALYRGSWAARLAAIIVVMFHLVSQFAWIGAFPWWSLIAITLDVLILYALVVHGEEMNVDA